MEGPRREQSKAGDAKALSRRSNTTRSDRNGSVASRANRPTEDVIGKQT